MRWKEFTLLHVTEFCEARGRRTFSLPEFLKATLPVFQANWPNNKHVEAKIRQQLQFLRNEGLVTFLDNSGHYTLRGIDLLRTEKEDTATIDVSREAPEKREYLIETYVRNVAWAREARDVFGLQCMCNDCRNTFVQDNGRLYIEVHHIIPLCEGGEDALWNLSVLCAHHHRMAHYGNRETRLELERFLIKEAKCRIQRLQTGHGQ